MKRRIGHKMGIMVNMHMLRDMVLACQCCPLCRTRTNVVFGEGGRHPDIMFIGEAPGKNEDIHGRPFVGLSGHLLRQAIQAAGLQPEDIYIANVLKCRPPNNRDPQPSEIAACARYLDAQIRLLKPGVIVPLGAYASRHVLNTDAPMGAMRGKPVVINGMRVLPTWHPAFTFYSHGRKDELMEDVMTAARMAQMTRHTRP